MAGVTFRVPASWTLDSDGQIAVAKNHEGDVRLVFWGGDTSDAPNALHRADAEFGVPFDVKVGSLTKQLAVGRLPYGFVLSQGALERDSRLIRLAMLSSKGVKSEALALLTYANTPKSDGAAASKRVADALDEILNTFEPEP